MISDNSCGSEEIYSFALCKSELVTQISDQLNFSLLLTIFIAQSLKKHIQSLEVGISE
jgi:hypothetical protein